MFAGAFARPYIFAEAFTGVLQGLLQGACRVLCRVLRVGAQGPHAELVVGGTGVLQGPLQSKSQGHLQWYCLESGSLGRGTEEGNLIQAHCRILELRTLTKDMTRPRPLAC